jgi:hypothetical protein
MNCRSGSFVVSLASRPASSKTLPARETRRRPPYQGAVPKVRRTGSHAFWLRTVPKAPGDAPSTATGFPPKTRPMSAGGRESQSIAFLNTPAIDLLYSGVARSSPSAATIASFSAVTRSGISASAHASALCHQMSDQISTSTPRLTHVPRREASPFKRPESIHRTPIPSGR